MKFFYKIFLSMLLVLTVSLATIEYLTVSYSLEHALQREENTALSQHQMAKYSIQTVLLGITDDYTTSNMENIAKSAETPLGGMLPVKRTIKNNKFLYRQPCYGWRYFMLLLYIAHDISLVSLHAVSFEVVGCCSNLCN